MIDYGNVVKIGAREYLTWAERVKYYYDGTMINDQTTLVLNVGTVDDVIAYLEANPSALLADVSRPKPTAEQIAQQLAEQARAERDRLILSIRWRIERHQDEIILDLEPTEPIEPILEYIQALRDVPQQAGFPEDIIWPEVP